MYSYQAETNSSYRELHNAHFKYLSLITRCQSSFNGPVHLYAVQRHMGSHSSPQKGMSNTHNPQIHVEQSLYGSSKDQFLRSEDEMSVQELIPQILDERKSFLNLLEDLLLQEIESKVQDIKQNPSDSQEKQAVVGTPAPLQDSESRAQIFQKQRLELLTHINSALNETSLSLDFVSLLLSAEKPAIAKATILPHLMKTTPLGSLSSDRLERSHDALNAKKGTTEHIGLGWKYQSLKHIKDLFGDSAAQLREEVAGEKVYWNSINKILAQGEVLHKLRDPETHAKALGVQYGYGDSGSSFYNKGRAILRKDEASGQLVFQPLGALGAQTTANRYVRVRILSKVDDDYMLTGQTIFDKEDLRCSGGEKLIEDIERARYFLFEDDLFYHLTREAKGLINYGVNIILNKIIIDDFDQIIEIETVVYDEYNEEELSNLYQNTNQESSKYNHKAQQILTFLKIMLCCYYNYNLELKQKIPTSFTKWKQHNSHPLMLRPLIGHIRHQVSYGRLRAVLQKLCGSLGDSIHTHISESQYENLDSNDNRPFQKAIQRPVSSFTVYLQNAVLGEHLKINVQLSTLEILVNLVVEVTVLKYANKGDLENNLNGSNVLQLTFTDVLEVEESLTWTLLNFLNRST